MKTLETLKKEILADGIIDEAEVNELQILLYQDGAIDKEEADFLFELNDATSGMNNHPSWTNLFVNAIASFLLEDEESPGEIDNHEATWLFNKMNSDGKIDATEKALLNLLKSKTKLPANLESLL